MTTTPLLLLQVFPAVLIGHSSNQWTVGQLEEFQSPQSSLDFWELICSKSICQVPKLKNFTPLEKERPV